MAFRQPWPHRCQPRLRRRNGGGVAARNTPQIDVKLVPLEQGLDGASRVERDAERSSQEVAGTPRQHPQGTHRTGEGTRSLHRRPIATECEDRVIPGRPFEDDLRCVTRTLGERYVAAHSGFLQCRPREWQASPAKSRSRIGDEQSALYRRTRALHRRQKCQVLRTDRPHCRGVATTLPNEKLLRQ